MNVYASDTPGKRKTRDHHAAGHRSTPCEDRLAATKSYHTSKIMDTDSKHEKLLTSAQAAKLLGVSRKHIWNLVQKGKLPAELKGERRQIRIAMSDLEHYANNNNYRQELERNKKTMKIP